MGKEKIEALIEGGKATAAPPLGPQLGPLGVNISQIVNEINQKTESFKGMEVPVTVEVDTGTKEFSIKVGTPPASSLIKKEAGVEKGAGNPLQDKVADLKMEQLIKIGKMKEDSLMGKTLKEKVKEIIGTCNTMGILVEGKPAKEALESVDQGKFDKEIKEEKTELTAEERKELEEERKRLAEEMKERREEFLTKAKEILEANKEKEKGIIKGKMTEAGVPDEIINEVMEEAAPAAAAAAEGKTEEEPAEEAPREEKKEAKEKK